MILQKFVTGSPRSMPHYAGTADLWNGSNSYQRLEIIAGSIASLRINSLNEQVEQLRGISEEIRGFPDDTSALQDAAMRALSILTRLFDTLGTRRGAQVIIAGATAGILMAGGWPSAVIFALTLAVWQGKEAFIAAVNAAR